MNKTYYRILYCVYDANGNMVSDANRGVSEVRYNSLNLPSRIVFNNVRRIENRYRADGVKLSSEVIIGKIPDDEVTIKSLVPGLITETMAGGDDAVVTPGGAKPLPDKVIDTKTYIGNYEFSGDTLLRLNTPYGYFHQGHYYVNAYDYQGNLVASGGNYACGVAQDNSYYPYGLNIYGLGNNKFTPYLFGGKEFEERQGLNLYDFHARTYAPDIARFMQPDPLATENMGVSPYTYCNGDPINNIDPDGMETHVFQNDSTMSKFASNYPDDGSINIVSHGNPTEIVKRTNGNRLSINTPELLKELINDNYETVNGNVSLQESIVIRILACKTGRDKDENTPSVAQTFSEGIPNAIIIAPNSRLCLKADGTMEAVDDNDDDIRSSNVPWRVFHRGKEFKVKDIPTIQKKLSNEIFF